MKCGVCFHDKLNKTTRCRFCNKIKRVDPCKREDCFFCYSHTLASVPKVMKEWSGRNNKHPREIWKSSSTKYWLLCGKCGVEYEQCSKKMETSKCFLCTKVSECKVYMFLRNEYEKVEVQAKFDWCKSFSFDIALLDLKIIIEVDGAHHFTPLGHWKTGWEVCNNDLEKEELALSNQFSIIRVLQKHVYSDSSDWRSFLKSAIEEAQKKQPVVLHSDEREYTSGIYARLRCDSFF